MKNFFRFPYDLKWIYDTDLAMDVCIDRIMRFAEEKTYKESTLSCVLLPDNRIQMIFRQAPDVTRIKRTRYVAEFYALENGKTAIVLRFYDELFWAPPFTCLDELDALFAQVIQAVRRKT